MNMNRAAAYPFETERLLIRPPRLTDVAAVHKAVAESYAALRQWMDWARSPEPQREGTDGHLRLGIQQWRELRLGREADPLPLLLFRREDGRFLGTSGFHNCVWEVPRLEMGYWLRSSAQGCGYMTEAVRAIAEAALTKWRARRISIWCDATNIVSTRVAERAGFALEARLREHRLHSDGTVQDTLIYARYSA